MGETVRQVEPVLLSARLVAAFLGCSVAHVWRVNAAGKMPAPLRLGGLTRWRRDELAVWISEGCPPRARWAWPQATEKHHGRA